MFKPLFWLFRLGGINPTGSRSDGVFSVVPFIAASVFSILSLEMYIILPYNYQMIKSILLVNSPIYFLSFFGSFAKAYFHKQDFISITDRLHIGSRLAGKYYPLEVKHFILFLLVFFVRMYHLFHSSFLLRSNIALLGTFTFAVLSFLQHTMVVNQLAVRFADLNGRLRAVAACPQTAALGRLRAELRDLLREHALLRRLVKHVNSFFAFNTFCGIISSLVFSINQFYTLLTTFDESREFTMFVILSLIQTYFILIVRLECCHRCSSKANEAVLIVHRMLTIDSPVELMEDVELFSLAQFRNPVTFTAAGVFNLDRGFITKAGAASLSYLIVAIQLRAVAGGRASHLVNATSPSSKI